VTSQPKPPKEDVKVGTLSSGSPAPARWLLQLTKCRPAFGDPNGIAGPGNPNRAANINQAGSPLLPGGPGYGNGGSAPEHTRLRRRRGAQEERARSGRREPRVSTFWTSRTPFIPRRAYLRIEGDVVLEVVFLASSQVQVIRVVSGLSHGLDETAIQAAKQIRFRPAKPRRQRLIFPPCADCVPFGQVSLGSNRGRYYAVLKSSMAAPFARLAPFSDGHFHWSLNSLVHVFKSPNRFV